FQVGIEASVHSVHSKSLGVTLEGKLRLLVHGLGVEHADGLITRGGNPDFLGGCHKDNGIGRGVEVGAGTARQRAGVEATDGRVSSIADVDLPFTDTDGGRTEGTLATA